MHPWNPHRMWVMRLTRLKASPKWFCEIYESLHNGFFLLPFIMSRYVISYNLWVKYLVINNNLGLVHIEVATFSLETSLKNLSQRNKIMTHIALSTMFVFLTCVWSNISIPNPSILFHTFVDLRFIISSPSTTKNDVSKNILIVRFGTHDANL